MSARQRKRQQVRARKRRDLEWLHDHGLEHLKVLDPAQSMMRLFRWGTQLGLGTRIVVDGVELRHGVMTTIDGLNKRTNRLQLLAIMERKLVQWSVRATARVKVGNHAAGIIDAMVIKAVKG